MTTGVPPRPGDAALPGWAASRERSNMLALRVMAFIAVHLGRRIARLVLLPITLYFVLFSPEAKRHSVRYLRRALGREPSFADGWRHVQAFASTVLDRVYLVRGQLDRFEFDVRDANIVDTTLQDGRGAFLLGAHLGSFEALHAVGATRPEMRVAMVMYPDNARMIHAVLQAIQPGFDLRIIAIGRAGSTLAIRDWLDGGGLAGFLGDRSLEKAHAAPGAATPEPAPGAATPEPAPSPASRGGGSVEVPFLGAPARFTDGPLRLAMLLKREVIFMVALYRGGRRYEIRFQHLADFRVLPDGAGEREALLHAAVKRYASILEALCREAPYNWFNFHDFWGEDAAR